MTKSDLFVTRHKFFVPICDGHTVATKTELKKNSTFSFKRDLKYLVGLQPLPSTNSVDFSRIAYFSRKCDLKFRNFDHLFFHEFNRVRETRQKNPSTCRSLAIGGTLESLWVPSSHTVFNFVPALFNVILSGFLCKEVTFEIIQQILFRMFVTH